MVLTVEKKIDELLSRGVSEVIDRDVLRKRLLSGQILRVKLGIDPTSPNLHIGRTIPLLKLRDFQELGHKVIFIIGDFTGVIGDTSDKESERPMLSSAEIHENLLTYKEQAGKILDMDKAEFRRNSEWLGNLGYQEIGEQADQFSIHDFISRDNIKKRLDAGKRVSLREMLYPLMQGYDSVAVRADVELGGTDQRFNLLAARPLQAHFDQRPQDIVMTNLILGTDGRKMSSSWKNTINILETPNEMFGQVMSISDDLIVPYMIHCTRIPMNDVRSIEEEMSGDSMNPRDVKIALAQELVEMYHDEDAADSAREYFENTFSKKQIPDSVPDVHVTETEISLIELLVLSGFSDSRGDARRKVEQGGVSIDGAKILNPAQLFTKRDDRVIIKCGKKDFFRMIFDQ